MPDHFDVDATEFLAGLEAALTEDKLSAEEVVWQAGEQVLVTAEGLVPRRTGDLALGLYESPLPPTPDSVSVEVGVKGVRYAGFVEFGTKQHGGPQPFLQAALEGGAQALVAAGIPALAGKVTRPPRQRSRRRRGVQ